MDSRQSKRLADCELHGDECFTQMGDEEVKIERDSASSTMFTYGKKCRFQTYVITAAPKAAFTRTRPASGYRILPSYSALQARSKLVGVKALKETERVPRLIIARELQGVVNSRAAC